ncbi:MAG TPA: hypothetical protein VN756_08845 [Solirubrobacterales bacterium]|nr:hypothetical protein [Solirubrobacterales bacterium]
MPVSGPEDKDPKNPAQGSDEEGAEDTVGVGVDVNEATLSEEDTLNGPEALAETRERHKEMAEEDEAERS